MKITDVKKKPQVLQESWDDGKDVEMPLGIRPSEFTEEYKNHLRNIKRRRPDLYNKMIHGN